MTYQERVDRLSELLESQLGIRGKTLRGKLRRAGRLLPKYVHRNAEIVEQAVLLQDSPKLSRQIDDKRVITAYNACEKYLTDIDASDRKWGHAISFLSTNALNLLIVAMMTMGVLVWRGFL